MKEVFSTKRPVCIPEEFRRLSGPLFCSGSGTDRGFTLLEVMLALGLLAFGVLGLARLQSYVIHYNLEARRMTEAGALAQRKMEELMALDYAHPALQPRSVGDAVELEGPFRVGWAVEEDAPEPEAKTLEVAVAWTDGSQEKWARLYCIKAR